MRYLAESGLNESGFETLLPPTLSFVDSRREASGQSDLLLKSDAGGRSVEVLVTYTFSWPENELLLDDIPYLASSPSLT